jgi:hypothetical protein
MSDVSFEAFMHKLDGACVRRWGLSIHDLSDCPFRGWFDDGMTVADCLDVLPEYDEIVAYAVEGGF